MEVSVREHEYGQRQRRLDASASNQGEQSRQHAGVLRLLLMEKITDLSMQLSEPGVQGVYLFSHENQPSALVVPLRDKIVNTPLLQLHMTVQFCSRC